LFGLFHLELFEVFIQLLITLMVGALLTF